MAGKKASTKVVATEVNPISMEDMATAHNSIADLIVQALAPVRQTASELATLKDAAKAAGEEVTNVRETVMGSLAKLSSDNKWTEAQIEAAAKLATDKVNSENSATLKVFLSQSKAAMHPMTRDLYGSLVLVRNAAWDAESRAKEADEKNETPIRKAFSRSYNLLISMLVQAKDGNVLGTPEQIVTFCKGRDPDVDVKKAVKQLKNIKEQILAMAEHFPAAELKSAVETLVEATEAKLTTARIMKYGTRKEKAALAQVQAPAPVAETASETVASADPVEAVLSEVA